LFTRKIIAKIKQHKKSVQILLHQGFEHSFNSQKILV